MPTRLERRLPGIAMAAATLLAATCLPGSAGAQAREPSRTYLKLIDPLDRPDDGIRDRITNGPCGSTTWT